MKTTRSRIHCLGLGALILGAALAASQARADELSLQQALEMAEKESPSLKAAKAREQGAGQATDVARSPLFPTLDAAAADSAGFPGSATGLDGFSGILASPYRSGPGADAFSKWDLIDLPTWHGLSAANYDLEASRQQTRLQRAQVDEEALGLYLQASRDRGKAEAWDRLGAALTAVRDTIRRFVRNGQYSQVQEYLIEDQLDDATMRRDDYGRRYRSDMLRIALLTGLKAGSFSCPAPGAIQEEALWPALESAGLSPLVARADAREGSATETRKKYLNENFPKIEAGASLGYLSDARLVQQQDYSVFVGATLPLFEGFRISAQEKQAAKEEEARGSEVKQAQLSMDSLNADYDERIEEARADLSLLQTQQTRADKAVALAKSRYLSFLGPLSDLQQGWKDMVDFDSQFADTRAALLLAMGSKAFANGGALGGK
jgi:outer membrane protein TolC